MIITIDGPVASGKSTVARALAQQLGYTYLNSGLLFRALAYIYVKERQASDEQIMHSAPQEIENIIYQGRIRYTYSLEQGARVIIDETDMTSFLKDPAVDHAASLISLDPAVRQALLEYQRNFVQGKEAVIDGRDAGTVVFPHADLKLYLTATLEVRAHRWQRDQLLKGNYVSLEESMHALAERDKRDSTRSIAPLKPAYDALILDTSSLTIQEVVSLIIEALPR